MFAQEPQFLTTLKTIKGTKHVGLGVEALICETRGWPKFPWPSSGFTAQLDRYFSFSRFSEPTVIAGLHRSMHIE